MYFALFGLKKCIIVVKMQRLCHRSFLILNSYLGPTHLCEYITLDIRFTKNVFIFPTN